MTAFRDALTKKTEPSSLKQSQLQILKSYPLLVPANANFTKYDGFLKVKESWFRISLNVPKYPSIREMELSCGWELKELLSGFTDDLNKLLETSTSLLQFLDDFHHLIEIAMDSCSQSWPALGGDEKTYEEQVNSLKHCSNLLAELKTLGTNHLQFLSNDFKTVSLGSCDSDGETHSLTLRILPHYAEAVSGRKCFEVIDTDLPEPVIREISKEQNIVGAYSKFCDYLRNLCSLWLSLALIDKECWVVDPKHPNKADMYRRISINNRVMAQISWNPLQPYQQPDIKFQGADADVDNLRSIYEQNLEKWSSASDVIQNICSVLSLETLPGPPDSQRLMSQAVDTGECCICYDVLLNGKLPEESCGKCLHNFHAACLYEWLEMMPGSRQVHGHISGNCPNCESIIKCPCPHEIV